MDANLDQFLEQLLIEKGITDLDDDVRAEVKANMAERILDQIDQACINALSEEKAAELAEKIDDENFGEKEMMDFIAGSGVDTAAIVASTLIQFRAFYLADSTPENAIAGNTASEDEAAEDMAENQEVTEAQNGGKS